MSHAKDMSSSSSSSVENEGKSNVSDNTHHPTTATATANSVSSSVLYTLLQDLGLTATAQALCAELQKQKQQPISATTMAAQSVAASLTNGPQSSNFPSQARLRAASGDQPSSSLESPLTTAKSQSVLSPLTPPPTTLAEMLPTLSPTTKVTHREVELHNVEAQCKALFDGNEDPCTAAAATLAACAVEPMFATSYKTDVPPQTSVAAIEGALLTLWKSEMKAVNATCEAGAKEFYISSLITRAAWCELHVTEVVFLQEYHLALTSSCSSLAGTAILHDAQEDLVDHVLQLMAALQELLTITGSSTVASTEVSENNRRGSTDSSCSQTPAVDASLSSVIMARLHAKALDWLSNAECVMAWVLQRQSYFDAPPPKNHNGEQQQQHPPQQRKRRCLEHTSTRGSNHKSHAAVGSDNKAAVPPYLQPLQNAILGIGRFVDHDEVGSTNGGRQGSTAYPRCLTAGNEQASAHSALLYAIVRLPSSVRLAMTIQRVKLLLTLMLTLPYNGEDSIVCTVMKVVAARQSRAPESNGRKPSPPRVAHVKSAGATEGALDVVRRWWTRRCVMQGQVLEQLSHRLRSLASADSAGAALRNESGLTSGILSFTALLDAQAKQLLLSPDSVERVVSLCGIRGPAVQSQRHHLFFAAALLQALEHEQNERAALLDRFVLEYATAASSVHLPMSLSTTTFSTHSCADALGSSNITPSSPEVRSETSSVNSPVWTLPLPNLRAPSPPAAAAASSGASKPLQDIKQAVNTIKFTTDAAASELSFRSAARVLKWQPHFTQLLTTIATGRWQAPATTQPIIHPYSQYNRTRLNLMYALSNAQELLRLQPRRVGAANGCEYVRRPGGDAATEATVSLVEQMPHILQLFTLQSTHALRRTQKRLTAKTAKVEDGSEIVSDTTSTQRNSVNNRAGALLSRHRRQQGDTSVSSSLQSAAPPSSAVTPPSQQEDLSSSSNNNHISTNNILNRSRGAVFSSLTCGTVSIAGTEPSLMRRLAAAVQQTLVHVTVSTATTMTAPTTAAADNNTSQESRQNSTPSTNAGVCPDAAPERATWSPDTAGLETAESLERHREQSSSASFSPVPSFENEEHLSTQQNSNGSTASSSVEAFHAEEGSHPVQSSNEEAAISIYDPEIAAQDDEEQNTNEETDEEWPQSAVDVEEGEDDDDEGEEDGSEASSADLDYERAEDAMKEEVECVEVTEDGCLLALLTARGRLTVLRLKAPDSNDYYDEEVLLYTVLPRVPEKRLQWYESLSSFLHFSPCRRFVLASVQFLAIHQKQSAHGALARTQHDNAGEVCVFSLHCDECESEGAEKGRKGGRAISRSPNTSRAASATTSGFSDHLQHLLPPQPERLYECFRPHTAPCLSARWIDPRWWGGGRRSRWANSATEPLNTTTAVATAVGMSSAEGVSFPPRSQTQEALLPVSWRVAAAVLLSEYQCLSIGTDDRIVRWMPSSGVVLQCIAIEPAQDLIVSPLMAAFYVISDAGDLYMFDAWDERDVGEVGSSSSIWSNSRDVCEHLAHPLMLPVTDDGHPYYCRADGSTQSYADMMDPVSRRRTHMNEESSSGAVGGGGGFDDDVHKARHFVHYTGAVTPVFQRMIDPVETRRRRMQTIRNVCRSDTNSSGVSSVYCSACARRGGSKDDKEDSQDAQGSVRHNGLSWSLRWLLPHRWTAHTPWDSQLGRRLLQHLLRRGSAPTYAAEGKLLYEREEESAGSGMYDVAEADALLKGKDAMRRAQSSQGQHNEQGDGAEDAPRRAEGADDDDDVASIVAPALAAEEDAMQEEEQMWEYDYTNSAHRDDNDGARPPPQLALLLSRGEHDGVDYAYAAAAADKPVAVRECTSHPTPARGSLRRAYYPSGACLVYKSVGRALCAAGDLADRQWNEEMGPGGLTHHLLSFAVSGEPQWTTESRLWKDNESGEGEEEKAVSTHEAPNRVEGKSSSANGASDAAQKYLAIGLPTTLIHWSTAALARVILWKNRLSSLCKLDKVPLDVWAQWETKVLTTTFHADTAPKVNADLAKSTTAVNWSAAELLASRGFLGARDVWWRGVPNAQRGLAATARNGRYLCIMASVGPYRKLVSPREPLRDMKGCYACVVFDVYAGAVLRVIPVCPVDPSGLHGLNMYTSQQHDMDVKMPLYRLQCAVTVVPVASANTSAQNNFTLTDDAAGPKEIVVLTVGGLANMVYVFDLLNGRRIACSRDVEHQCSVSAAAAYEASRAARVVPSVSTTTAPPAVERSSGAGLSASSPKIAVQSHSPTAVLPSPNASSFLPSTIRKPDDVLKSVATWGRGAGFDGITSRSRSTSLTSSSDSEGRLAHGVDGDGNSITVVTSPVVLPGTSFSAVISLQPQSSDSAARMNAARRALKEALSSDGGFIPRLLRDNNTAASSPSPATAAAMWNLRAILGLYHHYQHGAAVSPFSPVSAGNTEGRGIHADNKNSDWNWEATEEGDVWDWRFLPHQKGGENWTSSHAVAAVAPASRRNGGVGKTNGKSVVAHSNSNNSGGGAAVATAASRAPTLSSFYQALLGGPSANFNGDKNKGHPMHALASSHNAGWRQQRRHLLERVMRHYDVDLLWQAYVALFASSITAADSLAPQSAVAALVEWAEHTSKNVACVSRKLADSLTVSTSPWVWCSARRRLSNSGPIVITPYTHQQPRRDRVATGNGSVNEEGGKGIRAPTAPDDNAHSRVPFACVLQQREDFMRELHELEDTKQAKPTAAAAAEAMGASSSATHSEGPRSSPPLSPSRPASSLLSQMRTQAVLDGSLSPSAHLLHTHQSNTASATTAASRAALKLPPAHHQNQLRLDVVNAVSTWMDANGGFYVCFGSEDGGLYLLGGIVGA